MELVLDTLTRNRGVQKMGLNMKEIIRNIFSLLKNKSMLQAFLKTF